MKHADTRSGNMPSQATTGRIYAMAGSLVQRVIKAVGMSVAKTGDGRAGRRVRAYTTGQFTLALNEHDYCVSRSTVLRMCENGLIESYRTPGGDRRIPARELQRVLKEYRRNV